MPPLAPLIGASALGAATVGAVVAPGVQAVMSMTEGKPDMPQMPEVPKAEDAAKTAAAKAAAKRTAVARSRTLFTSPLGETTEAETARKTLLGA